MSGEEPRPNPNAEPQRVFVYAEQLDRPQKIIRAKSLYSQGARNFLVKRYGDAADDLSQVCTIYEDLYGELSDELGLPYLLYARSLIALAIEENRVVDMPAVEEDDDDDEVVDECEADVEGACSSSGAVTRKLANFNVNMDEADSSGDAETPQRRTAKSKLAEAEVSSSGGGNDEEKNVQEGKNNSNEACDSTDDDEEEEQEEEETDAAGSLKLAWEILELAAKIFKRQGLRGLANLAEVQTELANIEFENSIFDAAREDYEKALNLYRCLPPNHRRAMAEIHYKIGLIYLMQHMNKEGATSLKSACSMIDAEIATITEKLKASEKDRNVIKDLQETKQEIWAKITEIDEMQSQTVAVIRAALDNYIRPKSEVAARSTNPDGAGPSSSRAAAASNASSATSSGTPATLAVISSSSKPKDITHLIKRKKAEGPNSEAEAAVNSPAKRAAV